MTAELITRAWVESIVVGWNLCPFAKPVARDDRIRYVVCDAVDLYDQLDCLDKESRELLACDRQLVETTLIILPKATQDFPLFNDWLAEARQLMRDRQRDRELQLVGFHPQFRFADGPDDDAGHFTNRSPFPMVHLLRQISVTEANRSESFTQGIPARNAVFLRGLGRSAIEKALREIDA